MRYSCRSNLAEHQILRKYNFMTRILVLQKYAYFSAPNVAIPKPDPASHEINITSLFPLILGLTGFKFGLSVEEAELINTLCHHSNIPDSKINASLAS